MARTEWSVADGVRAGAGPDSAEHGKIVAVDAVVRVVVHATPPLGLWRGTAQPEGAADPSQLAAVDSLVVRHIEACTLQIVDPTVAVVVDPVT